MKKYWLIFLPAGEFGPVDLWAVCYCTFGSSTYPIAFFGSQEAARAVYPDAVLL